MNPELGIRSASGFGECEQYTESLHPVSLTNFALACFDAGVITPSRATLPERYDELRQPSASDSSMKITRLEPFILHAPVTRGGIADSTHALTHWGAPGVAIHTDSGLTGYGFSGTHAHLATDRLITDCIVQSYGPLLVGQELGADPREIAVIWEKLHKYPPIYWVG